MAVPACQGGQDELQHEWECRARVLPYIRRCETRLTGLIMEAVKVIDLGRRQKLTHACANMHIKILNMFWLTNPQFSLYYLYPLLLFIPVTAAYRILSDCKGKQLAKHASTWTLLYLCICSCQHATLLKPTHRASKYNTVCVDLTVKY